ncbi:hypothetical protein, partial [Hyphomonas adhaerens]|uniref:hypothetical protein n=1 Tax=Hyphomonas adhaerens TaxID=81029 RepID=UPI0024804E21
MVRIITRSAAITATVAANTIRYAATDYIFSCRRRGASMSVSSLALNLDEAPHPQTVRPKKLSPRVNTPALLAEHVWTPPRSSPHSQNNLTP